MDERREKQMIQQAFETSLSGLPGRPLACAARDGAGERIRKGAGEKKAIGRAGCRDCVAVGDCYGGSGSTLVHAGDCRGTGCSRLPISTRAIPIP